MKEMFTSENMQEAAEPVEEITEESTVHESAEPVEKITEESPQTGENEAASAEQPERDFEKDAAFAKIRREAEQAKKESQRLKQVLERFDFKGDTADDIADAAEAYHSGKSVEEIKKERAEKQRVQQLEEELNLMRTREANRVFKDDLASIKKSYPDESAKTVFDLGEEFVKLRANGIDALIAYDAIRAKRARETKPVPPSTGTVKSTGIAEKDYYSPDEVKAMSPKEVSKYFEKIQKSMKKWR